MNARDKSFRVGGVYYAPDVREGDLVADTDDARFGSNTRVADAVGEAEKRPAGLGRVAVGIATVWGWGRENCLRSGRKREAGERERDEEKESASQSRAVNRCS